MSLTDDFSTTFCFMVKDRIPDGEGGYLPGDWMEGTQFHAAITFDTSIEARVAEKQGVTSLYTITTSRGTVLKYHNVIKRLSDGKIFRVTSDGDDKFTPASAALDMRQVTAEEWRLTA